MKLMEVRCCCRPAKLLGYLPEPSSGNFWVFPLRYDVRTFGLGESAVDVRELDPSVKLEVHYFDRRAVDMPPELAAAARVAPLKAKGRSGFAYKAEGMTLEELRRIPGFMEALPSYANRMAEA